MTCLSLLNLMGLLDMLFDWQNQNLVPDHKALKHIVYHLLKNVKAPLKTRALDWSI